MLAILTGDIINSRKYKTGIWLDRLKDVLSYYGKEPEDWEIFRGDSFQLKVAKESALKAALVIKAFIKQDRGLDVRIAIGIGEIEYKAPKITESTGTAFIYSGQCFDNLKKYSMAIKTPFAEFDEEINLYIILALLTINSWTPNMAKIVAVSILHENLSQKEIAQMLNKSQSSISESKKRAGYEEIMKMEKRYRKLVQKYFNQI